MSDINQYNNDAHSIKEQLSDIMAMLKQSATKVVDKSGELASTVCDKASDANNDAKDLIKSKPYAAVASAFLTGWLIAKFL
ncbi:MAG: hypothetical protein K0R49_1628 [Burkholderiales bacterium]|jgi:ElaB/YqjD/DUF883 family membrane-anchored ribosome-binding protein|nr:hypothetical protein [Burkholderiales bacterium]MCE3269374.1 hypothetical protein [Burkholderiales bacterium]